MIRLAILLTSALALAFAGCAAPTESTPQEVAEPVTEPEGSEEAAPPSQSGEPGSPGQSGQPGEPGTPAQPEVTLEPVVLLETEFSVSFLAPGEATIEVPENAVQMQVEIWMATGVSRGFYFDGPGDACEDANVSEPVVTVGEDNGKGQAQCDAPSAGPHALAWGVEEGFRDGRLRVTAFVAP